MSAIVLFTALIWAAIGLILFFLLFWRFWFLRDPERVIPKGKNIVSPADGKIIMVKDMSAKNLKIRKGRLGMIDVLAKDVADEYTIVSIMMTPLDVHYQRSPIDGRIMYSKHTKGKFKNAVTDNIAIENEKNEILIKGDGMNIKVVQIAGAVARRIVSYVKKGDKIRKGDKIGLINLGSQVSMIMPKQRVNIKPGDKVKAGETIIAKC